MVWPGSAGSASCCRRDENYLDRFDLKLIVEGRRRKGNLERLMNYGVDLAGGISSRCQGR
jgi:hypothetical protein